VLRARVSPPMDTKFSEVGLKELRICPKAFGTPGEVLGFYYVASWGDIGSGESQSHVQNGKMA